jgi:hypothetical protein
MSLEKPTVLTEDERRKTEQRILSDAELIKEGAEVKEDGRLEVTKNQHTQAKNEHPKTRFYGETETRRGAKFSVGWDQYAKEYSLYIPGTADPGDEVILLGTNREFAEGVYRTLAIEALKIGADIPYTRKIAQKIVDAFYAEHENRKRN